MYVRGCVWHKSYFELKILSAQLFQFKTHMTCFFIHVFYTIMYLYVHACIQRQQTFHIQTAEWRSISYSCTSCQTYFVILQTRRERDMCRYVSHVHVCLCLLQQTYLYHITSIFVAFFSSECASYDDKLVLLPLCRMMSVCRKVLFALQLQTFSMQPLHIVQMHTRQLECMEVRISISFQIQTWQFWGPVQSTTLSTQLKFNRSIHSYQRQCIEISVLRCISDGLKYFVVF